MVIATAATIEGGTRSIIETLRRIWEFPLLNIEGRPLTIGLLVVFLLLVAMGVWMSRVLSRVLTGAASRRFKIKEGPAAAIQTLLFYLFVTFVVIFALNVINVPLTIFAVAGGAIAIGVGFGSQNVVNNFISGLILLIERPVRVGDAIQIDDVTGVVRAIGARSTRLVAGENVEIVVPNSTLLQNSVKNWTLSSDEVRSDIAVGVAYGSPVDRVRELLLRAADEHEGVLKSPAPEVLFEDFGDNALAFRLYVWMKMRRPFDRLRVQSDLRFAVDRLFRVGEIVVSFPQRDVHLESMKPLEVRILDRGVGDRDSEGGARPEPGASR